MMIRAIIEMKWYVLSEDSISFRICQVVWTGAVGMGGKGIMTVERRSEVSVSEMLSRNPILSI